MEPFTERDDPDVVMESHSHWAVGHVDGFSIRVYRDGEITEAFRTYHRCIRAPITTRTPALILGITQESKDRPRTLDSASPARERIGCLATGWITTRVTPPSLVGKKPAPVNSDKGQTTQCLALIDSLGDPDMPRNPHQ